MEVYGYDRNIDEFNPVFQMSVTHRIQSHNCQYPPKKNRNLCEQVTNLPPVDVEQAAPDVYC